MELDAKLEDELLKDDDIEEDDEKCLLDSTLDLLKSPQSSISSIPETLAVSAKKVSLKRNLSIPIPSVVEKSDESTVKTSDDAFENVGEPERKIVKITHLSAQERIELRAKKFGGSGGSSNVVSDDKLNARAARFGITSNSNSTTPSKTSTGVEDNVLKLRAERFGAITNDMKKTELEEKLQKRKERFGMAGKVALTSSAAADQAEKARLRLERFKTTSTA